MAEFHRSEGGSRHVVVDYHVAVKDGGDPSYDIWKVAQSMSSDDGGFGEFVSNWDSTTASGKLCWLCTGL